MPELTESERESLSPFLTNLDRPVFALRNLPEVVKGALFSRYSRTDKSLRRVLLDEFMGEDRPAFGDGVGAVDVERAEGFYERILVGYGDDSVAELGLAHVALERISNLATKVIEDARIGLSPLEKSTRYVAFDQKQEGRYPYVRPPGLDPAQLADFEAACDRLFDTYTEGLPRLIEWISGRFPQEAGEPNFAYRAAVRAKACDLLRGLLPAATATNMGVAGNGRAFEYLLVRMYADPLPEVRDLAAQLHEELRQVIPAFVRRAGGERGEAAQAALRHARGAASAAAAALGGAEGGGPGLDGPGVRTIRFDPDGIERVLAAIAFPRARESLAVLRDRAGRLPGPARRALLAEYLAGRQNRHHRPGRALEEASLTVEVVANFGAYRDLQRHRLLSQQRQPLGCELGYDLPPELDQLGLGEEARAALEGAAEAWERLGGPRDVPEAQYVVPLAYRMRWYMTLNVREAFHICELRSQQQGHPDYRQVALDLERRVEEAWPELAGLMTFVDQSPGVDLERRESERRTALKREALAAAGSPPD
ncbi:MAG: FAD-dependent thymidylate synthase [Candidatus Dormibacteria bacterium]